MGCVVANYQWGVPSASKKMGGVQRRSILSLFSEPGEEGDMRNRGCNRSVWIESIILLDIKNPFLICGKIP